MLVTSHRVVCDPRHFLEFTSVARPSESATLRLVDLVGEVREPERWVRVPCSWGFDAGDIELVQDVDCASLLHENDVPAIGPASPLLSVIPAAGAPEIALDLLAVHEHDLKPPAVLEHHGAELVFNLLQVPNFIRMGGKASHR